MAVGLLGDLESIMQQWLVAAQRTSWPDWSGWLKELRLMKTAYVERLAESARGDRALPMHPLHVYRSVQEVLPAGATLLFDIGDFGIWGRTYMPAEGPGRWIAPGPLGHLGSTLPMAIGCQAAHPRSAVVCFAGDGAMGFHFMEMDTAISHNLPVVLVVGNDSAFGIDRNYQMAYYGRPIGTERRPLRYDRIVAEMGGYGEHVERIEDVAGAVSRALSSDRPTVVNIAIRSVPCPLTLSRIRNDTRAVRPAVHAVS